jgi:Concanavalin A-like lectin/glucanases superfamily
MKKVGATFLILFMFLSNVVAQEVVGPLAFDVGDIDWSHPLLRGLINWWYIIPTLSGGNKWYDIKGFKHGTLTNMTAGFGFQATNKDEWFGEMRFGGTDDSVLIGTDAAFQFSNTTFTVVGWFRATSCPGSCYIVSRRQTGVGAWFVRVNSTGELNARADGAGATAIDRQTVSTAMIDGNWKRFAVVFTTNTTVAASNDATIYVNGALDQGTNGGTSTYAPGGNLAFGAFYDGSTGYLIGAMQDIRFYSRGWSASEAAADYMFYRASLAQIVGAPHNLITEIIAALFFPRRLPHVYQ